MNETATLESVESDDFFIESALSEVPEVELRRYEKLLDIKNTRIKFATEYHVNSRGERMSWEFPHILDLYEEVSPVVTVQGSTQCMKTEWVVCTNLAAMYCGVNVFFVLPKHNMRSTYVRNHLDRVIDISKGYQSVAGGRAVGSHLKKFGRGVTRYVSSNKREDFTEFPAEMVIVEELDHCDQENLLFAKDRLEGSPYKFYYRIGNPTIEGFGINEHYLAGDRKKWFIKCSACGKYRAIDWFKHVVRAIVGSKRAIKGYSLRDTEWSPGCFRDIHAICPCGGAFMRDTGLWKATKPENYYLGGASYHISSLMSLHRSFESIYADFVPAIYDFRKMEHFYRSVLGLPYSPGDSKVSSSIISDSAIKGFSLLEDNDLAYIEGDRHDGPCFLGMDVGNSLDVSVLYMNPRGTKILVFCGKLNTIEEVRDVLDRYNVRVAVVDIGPERALVRDFQAISDVPVWLCQYSESASGVSGGVRVNNTLREVLVDRTEHLDNTFKGVHSKLIRFPSNYLNIMRGTWYSEVTASTRTLVEAAKGKLTYRWSDDKPDHQFHALAYANLAAKLGGESISVHVG